MTTQLDATCALVVTDLEKGILRMAPSRVTDPVVEDSARLADAFHDPGLPVVRVHATGMPSGRTQQPKPDETTMPADSTELDPRLPAADGDLHVRKDKTFSAFPRTELAAFLAVKGACLDPNPARHANTLENVIPGIGTVTIVDEALAAVQGR